MQSGVVGVECWYRYNRLERRLSSVVVTRLSLLQGWGVCGWTQEALCRKEQYVHRVVSGVSSGSAGQSGARWWTLGVERQRRGEARRGET